MRIFLALFFHRLAFWISPSASLRHLSHSSDDIQLGLIESYLSKRNDIYSEGEL
jgi:hypothetical protein